MRTPKSRPKSGLARAIFTARWETGIGIGLLVLGILVFSSQPQGNAVFFFFLGWQALYYLSASAYSLISLRRIETLRVTSRADIVAKSVTENRAARWAVGLLLLLIVAAGLIQILPPPETEPTYARMAPIDIPVRQIIGLDFVPLDERDDPPQNPTATFSLTPTMETTKPAPPTLPAASPTPTGQATVQTPPTTPAPTQAQTNPAPTQPPAPTQVPTNPAPTQPPAPTQIPTNPAPTQPPAPTQVPTNPAPTPPAPTQIPTNPAPTQPPAPTQIPTIPAPTQPPAPTSPAPSNNPADSKPARLYPDRSMFSQRPANHRTTHDPHHA